MMQYQRASFGLFHHKAVSFGEIMVSWTIQARNDIGLNTLIAFIISFIFLALQPSSGPLL
jgi:hypothetical protein